MDKPLLGSSDIEFIDSKTLSGAVLAPVIVLSLYTAGKMGVKVYCSSVSFDNY
jgi:hypothetical protein